MRSYFGLITSRAGIACAVLLFLAAIVVSADAQATWTPIGPDGGDARALTAVPGHPDHLYLGTTSSLIYESTDGGSDWHRLAKLDVVDDLVIDHILVDPTNTARMYAAAWKFDRPDGSFWVSSDSGKNWKEAAGLHGQSIRTLAAAPSNPRILFVGTLQGIFRSTDAGANWTQISPPGSKEIHEVESLAVDPVNPDMVYAGTWHLPWKTTDGGKNWENIKQGIIDDSDVFSIIIDPTQPSTVYVSACSGIYKSEDAAALFKKIQGIPATARRTRVLRQDPVHRDTVYAGTTEGLYKTTDAGHTFLRMTGPDVIVNDVFVDPSNPERVLLATDRGGVLASNDGGGTFEAVNHGFSARKVEALVIDPQNPERVYAGVVNDKTYGGAFLSTDGGMQWKHMGDGLEGRDVFAMAAAADGTILAGTNSGIFALAPNADAWNPRNIISSTVTKQVVQTVHGKHVKVEKKVKLPDRDLTSRVNSLALSGETWAAATNAGLFVSKDKGATWQGGPVSGLGDYLSITSQDSVMVAARPDGIVLSNDEGENWAPMVLPPGSTRIHRVTFSADGALWVGAREGLFYTKDKGSNWVWVKRLPMVDITDLYYDAKANTILVSSRGSDFIYAINATTLDWKWHQTGFHLFLVRSAGDRLLAASLDDGVLVEPRSAGLQTSQK